PGGKAVLARSSDGRGRFEPMTYFSSSKFLFPAPAVVHSSLTPGLPVDLSNQEVVFVFGTGRENTGAPGDRWNNSYPYLAVHSLSDVAAKTGMVFSHPISANSVDDARPINEAVGTRREDKWVLVQHATSGERILIIRDDGLVFTHPVTDTVGRPNGIPPLP